MKSWNEYHKEAATQYAAGMLDELLPIIENELDIAESSSGIWPEDDCFVYVSFHIKNTDYGIVVMQELADDHYDLSIVDVDEQEGILWDPIHEKQYAKWETLTKNIVSWAKKQQHWCPLCDGEKEYENEDGHIILCDCCTGLVPFFSDAA